MSRPVVLDASAMIAVVKDEPGVAAVRSILQDATNSVFIHAVNASEVAYHLIRFGLPPMLAFQLASPEGVVIFENMARQLWQRSAVLKAEYRNLALGDCIAFALAESLRAELVTGDRLFKQVDSTARLKFFR